MNLSTFISNWTGKFVDFDKGGTFECVDLMRQYIVDVLGLSGYSLHALGSGGAKDLFLKFTAQDSIAFTKIANGPTNFPPLGAIVIFKQSLWFPFLFGWAGHVGICQWADSNSMILFNQNYPTHSSCQLRKFGYKDCLGWITRK